MAIYSVHEPPTRPRKSAADEGGRSAPERFVFVRDGFHFWAFLTPVLWMLRFGLWIVLLGYVALSAALVLGLMASGVSRTGATLALLAFAILIGLEAATLRCWTLRRNGWHEIGVVAAQSHDEAERRFFAGWTEQGAAPATRPAAERRPTPAFVPGLRPPPDVIGLFPTPETRR